MIVLSLSDLVPTFLFAALSDIKLQSFQIGNSLLATFFIMTNEPLSKKIKLAENNSDGANSQREAETQAAIEKIDEIQSELDALNDKASEEILQVCFEKNVEILFG